MIQDKIGIILTQIALQRTDCDGNSVCVGPLQIYPGWAEMWLTLSAIVNHESSYFSVSSRVSLYGIIVSCQGEGISLILMTEV